MSEFSNQISLGGPLMSESSFQERLNTCPATPRAKIDCEKFIQYQWRVGPNRSPNHGRFANSIGRFRLEHRSDVLETLPKRISDDSRRFVFRRQNFFFDENFGPKISFFANLAWFWRSHGRTELKINFLVKFCFRLTYPQVYAIKN